MPVLSSAAIGSGVIAASIVAKRVSSSQSEAQCRGLELKRIPASPGCWARLAAWFASSAGRPCSEEDLEKLFRFLCTVPLFQVALPRDQLPRIAAVLVRREWDCGEIVIGVGERVPGFCVIMEGEATVTIADGEGGEHQSVNLRRGDYWGERALHRDIVSDYTLVAGGQQGLVALMLTMRDLARLGLQGKVRILARPAMLEGKWRDGNQSPFRQSATRTRLEGDAGRIAPSEVPWVASRMKECKHLRALLSMRDNAVQEVASKAVRREVAAGTVLATGGGTGTNFFVIAKGAFEAVPHAFTKAGRRKSAEAVVACERLAERNAIRGRVLRDLMESESSERNCAAQSPFACKTAFNYSVPQAAGPSWRRHSDTVGMQASVLKMFGIPSLCGVAAQVGFGVGFSVLCVGGLGLPEEVGTVLCMPEDYGGQALVQFSSEAEAQMVPLDHLSPATAPMRTRTLGEGSTFGELAALYDSPCLATLRATEDGVVYEIPQLELKSCLKRDGQQVEEGARLLDEVEALAPLLQVERLELARVAVAILAFQPGEEVLKQGVAIPEPMWYVISEGSCIAHQTLPDGQRQDIREFFRAQHFGEWSILRGEGCMRYGVEAGPSGARVLVIGGGVVRQLRCFSTEFQREAGEGALGALPNLDTDAGTYLRAVCKNAARRQRSHREVPIHSLKSIALLGEGSFGKAFLVEAGDGQQFALKRMGVRHIEEHEMMGRTKFERELMSLVDNRFVIHLYRAFTDSASVYFLMEAATGGHLADLLFDYPEVFVDDRPHGSAAMFYAACVASGCGYLHSRHIVHRDIKLENVVIDARGYAKLCDLGFARLLLGKAHTFLGTPHYMAPELIEAPHVHGFAVDWWALGVLVFELLAGQSPWDVGVAEFDNPWAQVMAVQQSHSKGPPLKLISRTLPLAKDFVSRLLTSTPHNRLGWRGEGEVKAHAWFSWHSFDFSALDAGLMSSPFVPGSIERDPTVERELSALAGRGQVGLHDF